MRNKLFFAFLSLLIPVLSASAHVKWFAYEDGQYVEPYRMGDIQVIISIFVGLIILGVGLWLDRKLNVSLWMQNLLNRLAPSILSVASIGFGLSFIIFSYNGFIFAPNLVVTGTIGIILIAIQTIAGVMMLLGFYERVGGMLLAILFLLGIQTFGFYEMMDTFEMLGFAVYAMIIGRPKWKITESQIMCRLTHHMHSYGVSVLRVATGINLIVLGLSEKILNPSLTHNFLLNYHWNFMSSMGPWFSDYWFAYAAGFTELIIGLFLLFGFVTRLTVIFLAVFLVTTLVMLGPIELMGHLPHFSIACVLLVFGAGSRLHYRRLK